jgi:hypothetical protein
MLNKTHVLAIAVAGGALAASAWLMQSMSRRRQASEHELALEVWDNECGPPAIPAVMPTAKPTAPPAHAG